MSDSLADRPRFLALTALLPPRMAYEVLEGGWDIGGQEATLTFMVTALKQQQTPLTEEARCSLAGLVETWGMWEALSEDIHALPASDADDTPYSLLAPARAEILRVQLEQEMPLEHLLRGWELMVWMGCDRCDDILAALYTRMPWGLDLVASHYAVVHPTWSQKLRALPYPRSTVFNTPYEALDYLTICQR